MASKRFPFQNPRQPFWQKERLVTTLSEITRELLGRRFVFRSRLGKGTLFLCACPEKCYIKPCASNICEHKTWNLDHTIQATKVSSLIPCFYPLVPLDWCHVTIPRITYAISLTLLCSLSLLPLFLPKSFSPLLPRPSYLNYLVISLLRNHIVSLHLRVNKELPVLLSSLKHWC